MHFRDVSHYVSRTNQQHKSATALVALARPWKHWVTEFAPKSKNSLSNSDQFCYGSEGWGFESLRARKKFPPSFQGFSRRLTPYL